MLQEVTTEVIDKFFEGHDPMERIVNIECGYSDDAVSIIYRDEDGIKRIKKDAFHPFVWCKNKIAIHMFDKCGEKKRQVLVQEMNKRGIACKGLEIHNKDGETFDRLENGYRIMFYAKRAMSYSEFLSFFKDAGTPVYVQNVNKAMKDMGLDGKEFLAVSPVEQYMMASGKRLFKGYENYDDLVRMQFDLETEGLNPEKHAITQIGIRTNKGFEKVLAIDGTGMERKENELRAIQEMLQIISTEKPDVIAGHNSENFDWPFVMKRLRILGTSLEVESSRLCRSRIYKSNKEAVLKLGGEVEYYYPTKMWGTSIIDSMHAARRAMASDSSIRNAGLKYLTDYIGEKKDNRVYVPGDKIQTIWDDTEHQFAFNNVNGDWYIYDPSCSTNVEVKAPKPGVFVIHTRNTILDGYQLVTGRYIVQRYLLDDIYETDKVELKFNESNFQINKILPTTFERACTMGTAGIWKLIVLAYFYENGLAVPAFTEKRKFVGGLSRLLCVGFIDRVVKLDYNSLYPSIMLTWGIESSADIFHILLPMLDYVLTNRERYKELKGESKGLAKSLGKLLDSCTPSEIKEFKAKIKQAKSDAVKYDKLQAPFKCLGNSVFGASSNPELFPLGDVDAGEMTTCTGRQSLRLMIQHFSNIGTKFKKENGEEYGIEYNYRPIVGDSVTGDTPIFIKYKMTGMLDIKPIEEIFNNSTFKVDEFGREYDTNKKNYQILCRSGWSDINYVYRHEVNKDIYRVTGSDDICVDVTEDHSLFDDKQAEIKPSEITKDTKLETYIGEIKGDFLSTPSDRQICTTAVFLSNGQIDRVPTFVLNSSKEKQKIFLDVYTKYTEVHKTRHRQSKTCKAGLLYLKNQTNK